MTFPTLPGIDEEQQKQLERERTSEMEKVIFGQPAPEAVAGEADGERGQVEQGGEGQDADDPKPER